MPAEDTEIRIEGSSVRSVGGNASNSAIVAGQLGRSLSSGVKPCSIGVVAAIADPASDPDSRYLVETLSSMQPLALVI